MKGKNRKEGRGEQERRRGETKVGRKKGNEERKDG